MSNRQLEEIQQENADNELAKKLGITYEELSELEYTFEEETSNDGLVYRTFLEFNPEIGKEILEKINLDSNNTFTL